MCALVALEGRPAAAQDVGLYEEACDDGDESACNVLGLMTEFGQGVTADLDRAAGLYERACDGEVPEACARLGAMHQAGVGVPRNPERAASLYERACDGGLMPSCTHVGVSYEQGEGVTRDVARAAALYQQACLGGTAAACLNIGITYENGDVVASDIAQAASFYALACQGGVAAACSRFRPPPDPDGNGELFVKRGDVVEAETGVPLDDAILDIPELGMRAISDASGQVEVPEMPTGRYLIVVERSGYEAAAGEINVPGAERFQVQLSPSPVDDPDAPGRILGRVTDDLTGQGVSAVDVAIAADPTIRAMSDGQGRFRLSGIEPGLVEVELNRLGYEPRTSAMIVHPGRTVEVEASISTRPIQLDPIEVVAVRSPFLEQAGFYDRAERMAAWGSQFSYGDIEAMNPIATTDILRRATGISVEGGQALSNRLNGSGGQGCVLATYVDGVRMDGIDMNSLPPEFIEAVEVYQGVGMPVQYMGNQCGVVLLWTRRGR